jgi:ribonucleoside-diphosphate reductase alpha chain
LLAGASASIEPYFALALSRRVLDGRLHMEVNPLLEAELAQLGAAGQSARAAIRQSGSLRSQSDLPQELRRRFPIALEIAPLHHVGMQAAFQKHIDAAVSKTVNLPPDAPPSTVREIFTMAHELHLKGITVYRYGSRSGQTLSLIDEAARPDCRECGV